MIRKQPLIYGMDPSKIEWDSPDFSIRRLEEAVHYYGSRRLREAAPETTFAQLLRAGIQQYAINQYQTVPVVYPDLITEITSKRYYERYAPLYRPMLPKIVNRGEAFPQGKVAGLDVLLINLKFGILESFERELFDDDQTSQIRNRAAMMGENFRIMEEIYVMGKITGTGLSDSGVVVPASVWNPVYTTARGNIPAAGYSRLKQSSLEQAAIDLMNVRDPLGNKFLVVPTTILASPIDMFVGAKLLNSALQPSVPTATAGDTGYTMTANPLQGLFTLKVSRFLPSKACYLGDFKKGVVLQRRDPLEVVQETPQSGDSFKLDVYNFRARSRFEADIIEPRFLYQINDGSV